MGLEKIADNLDAALAEANEHLVRRQREIVESDSRKMAHYILRHVLEKAPAGTDPVSMGRALVQGAVIGEDESGGELASPVISFLESVLAGAKAALADETVEEGVYDPVDHAVQYHETYGRWPASASPDTIARAESVLADRDDA